jgi:hypothetical protein
MHYVLQPSMGFEADAFTGADQAREPGVPWPVQHILPRSLPGLRLAVAVKIRA